MPVAPVVSSDTKRGDKSMEPESVMTDKMREAMIDQDGAVWEKIGGAWSLYRQAARTVPEGKK